MLCRYLKSHQDATYKILRGTKLYTFPLRRESLGGLLSYVCLENCNPRFGHPGPRTHWSRGPEGPVTAKLVARWVWTMWCCFQQCRVKEFWCQGKATQTSEGGLRGVSQKYMTGSHCLCKACNRAVCEAAEVEPKVQWRPWEVGDFRNMEYLLRQATDAEQSLSKRRNRWTTTCKAIWAGSPKPLNFTSQHNLPSCWTWNMT